MNLYAFCGGDPVNRRELYGLCDDGGGLMGSIASAWNWFTGRVSDGINWLGGLLSGGSSDQPAQPDSNANSSAGTNSGGSSGGGSSGGGSSSRLPGELSRDQVNDGQLSKFDRLRLQGAGNIYQDDGAYRSYLNALNPLREQYSYAIDSMDQDGSYQMQSHLAEYLSEFMGGYSSAFAGLIRALAADAREAAELAATEFYYEMDPFEVFEPRYTNREAYEYMLRQSSDALHQETLRQKAEWNRRYGLDGAMPVRNYSEPKIEWNYDACYNRESDVLIPFYVVGGVSAAGEGAVALLASNSARSVVAAGAIYSMPYEAAAYNYTVTYAVPAAYGHFQWQMVILVRVLPIIG